MERTDDYKKRDVETKRLRRQNVTDDKRVDRLEKERFRLQKEADEKITSNSMPPRLIEVFQLYCIMFHIESI